MRTGLQNSVKNSYRVDFSSFLKTETVSRKKVFCAAEFCAEFLGL